MVQIEEHELLELIFWARRYCDGRSTFAPSTFNKVYQSIRSQNPDFIDIFDSTLMSKGKFWPYAQDGTYNPTNGQFDARPISSSENQENSNER